MERLLIEKALLPLHHVDNESNENTEDRLRLNSFLKASGKPPITTLSQASVLIPLVKSLTGDSWDIILTRRATHLKHHAGEISFPGGRHEPSDQDLQATAIRETNEEIGISADHIDIIGKLPVQATISQFQVTPFIGIIDSNYQIEIDTNEVAESFLVPFSFVTNQNNHKKIDRILNGQTFSYFEIEYNRHRIWGATAQMLVRLSQRLINVQ